MASTCGDYVVRWQELHYTTDGNRVYQGSECNKRVFATEKEQMDFYEELCKDDNVYNIECF